MNSDLERSVSQEKRVVKTVKLYERIPKKKTTSIDLTDNDVPIIELKEVQESDNEGEMTVGHASP